MRVAPGVTYVSCALVEARLLAAARRSAPRPVLLDCAQLALLDYAGQQVPPARHALLTGYALH